MSKYCHWKWCLLRLYPYIYSCTVVWVIFISFPLVRFGNIIIYSLYFKWVTISSVLWILFLTWVWFSVKCKLKKISFSSTLVATFSVGSTLKPQKTCSYYNSYSSCFFLLPPLSVPGSYSKIDPTFTTLIALNGVRYVKPLAYRL